jgi:hypothetical protein
MKRFISCLSIIFASFAMESVAANTLVQWGEMGGTSNIVSLPIELGNIPTTYAPGNQSNPDVGPGYYPDAAGRSPVFNAAANDAPVSRIPLEFPGAINQITMGTGQTNFQQMVVWEDFLADQDSVSSFSIMLFAYGPGFKDGTYSFLVQKDSGKWYASKPKSLTKAEYTKSSPVDATALTWHEFTPLNNGAATVGAEVEIDLGEIKSVGYYSNINGVEGYVGTYTAYFQATTGAAALSATED